MAAPAPPPTPADSTSAPVAYPEDRSSRSNPHEIAVVHLNWTVRVDFSSSTLSAVAQYTVRRSAPTGGSSTASSGTQPAVVSFDTSTLTIQSVADENGKPLDYTLHPVVPSRDYLGQQLDVRVPALDVNPTVVEAQVLITYQTSKQASALQWLRPAQTIGKVHPYLFTQCQAIHARSLLPCQDRPGCKFTYTARVTVPKWATCVMSAVLQHSYQDGIAEPVQIFEYHQPVAIPSYLLALAVGVLGRQEISKRCAIFTEPALLAPVAREFAPVEQFLSLAEEITGLPYQWGRYDILCLPPSFPYGGMENPCLTFVTPTLLAGDQSLVSVIAHEIAHSWTGNLVTNATWDHFWLNEGWTRWLEYKILARYHSKEHSDLAALGGYNLFLDSLRSLPPEVTSLVLKVGESDPDDLYSYVAYQKGESLLRTLESIVGTPAFESFFQAYVAKFAHKTLTSQDFRAFFQEHFASPEFSSKIQDFDWDTWLYGEGPPPQVPNFDRSLATQAETLGDAWLAYDQELQFSKSSASPPKDTIKDWTTSQTTLFLDRLLNQSATQPLQVKTVNVLHDEYKFGESRNAEILFRYCRLAVAAGDESMIKVALYFVTSQGRMKYVCPLFRDLLAKPQWRELAKAAFLQNKDFYHPICAKMVAKEILQCDDGKAIGRQGVFAKLRKHLSKAVWVVLLAVVAAAVVQRQPRLLK